MLPDLPGWDSLPTVTRYHNWAEMAGIIAVAFLVIAELVSYKYGQRKDALTEQQQFATNQHHEEEMARLHLETAQMRDRAAKSELELARLSTPRFKFLTPEAAASVVQKVAQFRGTKFDIGHATVGREQWDLLWHLEPLFRQAGWVFVDWEGPQKFGKKNWTMETHAYGVANVVGVSIELDPENREKLLPAASALADALSGVGIATIVEPVIISSTSTNADAVHVLVGEKQ